jgi:hypothetical protein
MKYFKPPSFKNFAFLFWMVFLFLTIIPFGLLKIASLGTFQPGAVLVDVCAKLIEWENS